MQLLLHGLSLTIVPLNQNHPGYYKSYIFTGDPCSIAVPVQPSVLIFKESNCSDADLFSHLNSLNIVGSISNLTQVPEALNMYYMSNEDIDKVLNIISEYTVMDRYPIIAITEPNHLWQLILIILLILLGLSCIMSGILHWYLYTPDEEPIRMLSDFQFNTLPVIDKTTYALDHDEKSVEENLCPICLDALSMEVMSELPCHHYYHRECIQYWLTKKSSFCPVCKHDCLTSVTEDIGWLKRMWLSWRQNGEESQPLLSP
eukprot:NODE_12_length_45166_cov_0.552511.p15 type:complete len:259 gc:universal NODE_12_length_45166_cov_0.552511:25197-24421(-)